MSDILLAKPKLDKGWIDCSVGEAHIVRDSLFNTFNILPYEVPVIDNLFEYQDSQGYKPLVDLLEDKYQAPVIVCNGAKNALGAIFYALKQSGRNTISYPLFIGLYCRRLSRCTDCIYCNGILIGLIVLPTY
jgi:hypothetical protein